MSDKGVKTFLLVVGLVVVGWFILTFGGLVVGRPLVRIPTAIVCDRGYPNTEVHISSTTPQGRFVKSYVAGCVLYTHVARRGPLD